MTPIISEIDKNTPSPTPLYKEKSKNIKPCSIALKTFDWIGVGVTGNTKNIKKFSITRKIFGLMGVRVIEN